MTSKRDIQKWCPKVTSKRDVKNSCQKVTSKNDVKIWHTKVMSKSEVQKWCAKGRKEVTSKWGLKGTFKSEVQDQRIEYDIPPHLRICSSVQQSCPVHSVHWLFRWPLGSHWVAIGTHYGQLCLASRAKNNWKWSFDCPSYSPLFHSDWPDLTFLSLQLTLCCS